MKKSIIIFVSVITLCLCGLGGFASAESENLKAYYTIDANSGYVIAGKNVENHLPIASMVKIMTALIGFESVDSGAISFDDEVTISKNASDMGGSQMFLEEGDVYKIGDLFKGIIVVSANDACVQLAETLKGSQEEFVKVMNEKAKSLGMNDTCFVNCTGLPAKGQYSCAKDVAIMLKELLKYEKYHELSKIWMEDFQHPDGRITQFVNTNKLIRFYKDCTGGKTGFTNEAGFCLSASARRNGSEIISVVIGANSSKTRFDHVRSQFEYAFANYETVNVLTNSSVSDTVKVISGKEESVGVAPSKPYYAFCKKGEKKNLNVTVDLSKTIKAPVKEGQVLGAVTIIDGAKTEKIDLIAKNDVDKLNYIDIVKNITKKW